MPRRSKLSGFGSTGLVANESSVDRRSRGSVYVPLILKVALLQLSASTGELDAKTKQAVWFRLFRLKSVEWFLNFRMLPQTEDFDSAFLNTARNASVSALRTLPVEGSMITPYSAFAAAAVT